MKGKKGGFYRYISHKRQTGKNVGQLLNRAGHLVSENTEKTSVLSALFSLVSAGKTNLQGSLGPPCFLRDRETSGISKNCHCWRRTRLRDPYPARMNTSQSDGMQPRVLRELMPLQDLSWIAIREGSWGLEESQCHSFLQEETTDQLEQCMLLSWV